ncbi:GMC oxidoreductase [Myxococcota bacterium]|nr:GMC oxidoreductase [Myxococcota bacterium]
MTVAVIGSGPSGVAVASALLEGGVEVEMLDFGHVIDPEAESLAQALREESAGPEDRRRLESVGARRDFKASLLHWLDVLRGKAPLLDVTEKLRLGSGFAFEDVGWGVPARAGGAPLARSLARGGLSNVWGAACYPLAKGEFTNWPLAEVDLSPHYTEATRILSLSQIEDGLSSVYPLYGKASGSLPLNEAARGLANHWASRGDRLAALGVHAGRARLAVRSEDNETGVGCRSCGLCLSGCPYDSIYRADWTLERLEEHASFRYQGGLWVQRFVEDSSGVRVEALAVEGRERVEKTYRAVFLAAGTLSSLRIAAQSLGYLDRPVRLFDNDLYLVPLWCRAETAVSSAPPRFSLNELALRIEVEGEPLHVQLYAMSSQVVERFRPLLSILPKAVQGWIDGQMGRLMLGFVFLPGRSSARIEARVVGDDPVAEVRLSQQRNAEGRKRVGELMRFLRRHREDLGLVPVWTPFRSTPAGHSGGHLAGGLPMTASPGVLETDSNGQLQGAEAVFAVDSAVLPDLPAQNSTYTIMANAHRIGVAYAAGRGLRPSDSPGSEPLPE